MRTMRIVFLTMRVNEDPVTHDEHEGDRVVEDADEG